MCAYFCAHKLTRARSYGLIVLQIVASIMLQGHNSGAGYCLALANDTYGLCCLRAYLCVHQLTRARSYVVIPPIGIAMAFLLQIRMSWLRALLKGCRCWCCELAERAFKTGGGAGRVLAPLPVLSAGKARRRWCQLVVRAVEVP